MLGVDFRLHLVGNQKKNIFLLTLLKNREVPFVNIKSNLKTTPCCAVCLSAILKKQSFYYFHPHDYK